MLSIFTMLEVMNYFTEDVAVDKEAKKDFKSLHE